METAPRAAKSSAAVRSSIVPERCRSAFRLSFPAWQRVHNVGFRVVCEEPKPVPSCATDACLGEGARYTCSRLRRKSTCVVPCRGPIVVPDRRTCGLAYAVVAAWRFRIEAQFPQHRLPRQANGCRPYRVRHRPYQGRDLFAAGSRPAGLTRRLAVQKRQRRVDPLHGMPVHHLLHGGSHLRGDLHGLRPGDAIIQRTFLGTRIHASGRDVSEGHARQVREPLARRFEPSRRVHASTRVRPQQTPSSPG